MVLHTCITWSAAPAMDTTHRCFLKKKHLGIILCLSFSFLTGRLLKQSKLSLVTCGQLMHIDVFYKISSGTICFKLVNFFQLSLSEAVQFVPIQSLCFVQIQHQPRPLLQYKILNLTVRDLVNTRLCALSSFFRLFHPVTKVEGGGAYISEGWAKGKWVNGLRASRLFFSPLSILQFF